MYTKGDFVRYPEACRFQGCLPPWIIMRNTLRHELRNVAHEARSIVFAIVTSSLRIYGRWTRQERPRSLLVKRMTMLRLLEVLPAML